MLRLAEAVGVDSNQPIRRRVACFPHVTSTESVDPNVHKAIFGGFPSGVVVVTAVDGFEVPVGLTVSAIMSLSLSPAQLVISLDSNKYTAKAIERTGAFAVNFLSEDQQSVASLFACPQPDKFAGLSWERGAALGAPIIRGVRAFAECRADRFVRSGDHTMVIGTLLAGAVGPEAGLAYCDRRYVRITDALAGTAGRPA